MNKKMYSKIEIMLIILQEIKALNSHNNNLKESIKDLLEIIEEINNKQVDYFTRYELLATFINNKNKFGYINALFD